MDNAGFQTVSIRIPTALYDSLKRIAEQQKISFNRLTVAALSKQAEAEQSRRLTQAILEIAKEPTDIEYYLPAQAEVVLGEPE